MTVVIQFHRSVSVGTGPAPVQLLGDLPVVALTRRRETELLPELPVR